MSECLLCYDHTEDIISCGHNCHYDCLASVMIKSSNKTIENKCCFCFKDFDEQTLTNIVKNCSKIKELLQISIKKDNVVLIGLIQEHRPQERLMVELYSIRNHVEFYEFIKKNGVSEKDTIIYALIVADNFDNCFHYKTNIFRTLIIDTLDIRTENQLDILINYIKENLYTINNPYIIEMFLCLANKCLSDEMLNKLVSLGIDDAIFNRMLVKYNNISDDLVKIIMQNNNHSLLHTLIKYGYEITEEMVDIAITHKSVEILHKLLDENIWTFTKKQIILIAYYGLNCVFWKLYKKNMLGCLDDEIILIAEKNIWGTLYICEYIPDKKTMIQIYNQNQLEKFEYYLPKLDKNTSMEIKLELGI